ncbi:hypothetical protein [Prochlorococcus sp. ALOHA_ZT_50]|jgi:hypothetical protein|uniref:hypothetical protein n=1 Tax=Prochlorococcus sp. ALOHA_ZT_50 TaxID=2919303 RepID=UPI0025794DA5|nr:hypothetical protein [Prochlorococcus sp. ALOHA_ZT_50]MCH2079622.1 hypothetical protein [Prochlorococcus sp. ALOHA_ZT_50]
MIKTLEQSVDNAILGFTKLESEAKAARQAMQALGEIINNQEENRAALGIMSRDPNILNDVKKVAEAPILTATSLHESVVKFLQEVGKMIAEKFNGDK